MSAARTPATSGVDPHGLFKLPSKLKKTLTADHASVAVYAQIMVRDFFVKHGYTAALEKFEAEQREMDERAHVPKAHADGAARNRLRVENMVESFCDDSEAVDPSVDGASAVAPIRTQRWITDEDGLVERLVHSLIDLDGIRALDAIEAMPGGFSVGGRSYKASVAALREAEPTNGYQPKFPTFITSPTSVQRMFAIAEAAKPKDSGARALRAASTSASKSGGRTRRRARTAQSVLSSSSAGESRSTRGGSGTRGPESEMTAEFLRSMRLTGARGGPPDHAKQAQAAIAEAFGEIQKELYVPDAMKLKILKRDLAVAGANHELGLQSYRLEQQLKKQSVVDARREGARAHRDPDRRTACACCTFPFAEKNLHMQVTYSAIIAVQRSWPLPVEVDAKFAAPPLCYDARWVCVMCAQFFGHAIVEADANPVVRTKATLEATRQHQRRTARELAKSRLYPLSGDTGSQWWVREQIEVGEQVTHPKRGDGTVIRINPKSDRRVHVEFAFGEIHRYAESSWVKFHTKVFGSHDAAPKRRPRRPRGGDRAAAAAAAGGDPLGLGESGKTVRKRAPKGYLKPSARAAQALERRRRGMRALTADAFGDDE